MSKVSSRVGHDRPFGLLNGKHVPYSPNYISADCSLFPNLKKFLDDKRYRPDTEASALEHHT